jgi:hypothetical protein
MECIERAKIDYMLVVKKMDITDPAFKLLTKYKMFVVEGRLARDWLIDLYDLADLVLLPSRGGSFELSGLEALGRGVPVLMPNVGPWIEYTPPGLEKYLHVKTARMVEPLPGNQIHSGKGAEWDPEDACLKFVEIYTNYDEVKAQGAGWRRVDKEELLLGRGGGKNQVCVYQDLGVLERDALEVDLRPRDSARQQSLNFFRVGCPERRYVGEPIDFRPRRLEAAEHQALRAEVLKEPGDLREVPGRSVLRRITPYRVRR